MTRVARYDAVVEFYPEFAPDVYDDPPMAALLQLIGDIRSFQLLDLACGHGRLTRELARRGAHVIGAGTLYTHRALRRGATQMPAVGQ